MAKPSSNSLHHLNPKIQKQARHCDICGKRYLRRNLAEAWMIRSGIWVKIVVRECTSCMTPQQAQRMLISAHVAPPQFKQLPPKPIASR